MVVVAEANDDTDPSGKEVFGDTGYFSIDDLVNEFQKINP